MTKELIGLNTYLYTFNLPAKITFEFAKKRLSKFGTITEVFIDNKLAFELKLFINN